MFDEIEIPDDLSGLSVTELQALLDKINEAGKATAEAAKEAEGDERKELATTLESLKDAKTNVNAALDTAKEAEAAADAALDEAAAAFDDPTDETEETEEEAETPAEPEADAEVTEEIEEPVAASGVPTKLRVPARRERRQVPEANTDTNRPSPFRTGGGDRVESLSQLAELFQRAGKAAGLNGDGMARVARLNRFEHLDPATLVHGIDARRNQAIMAAAQVEPEGLIMAAGGFCGPNDALNEIEHCGRTDRPVSALLATLNARGKFRYVKQTGLEAVGAGIQYWTEADDIAVAAEGEPKACYHLECEEELEAIPVAIPLCFQYGTFQNWTHPEQVAAALAKFDVALARKSEALVMQRIHEQSNQYTYTPPLGESVTNATIRLVATLLQLAGYNGRNSLDGYVLVVPEALILDLIVDSAIKAWVGPTLENKARIIAQLEDRFNIRVVESPDVRALAPAPVEDLVVAPLPAGGAVPCPHTRQEVLLLDPSDFRHGVDNVDIVVQTDIATARANDKSVFLETIETTEKIGCKPSFSVLIDGVTTTGAQPDLVSADEDYCTGPTPNPYLTFPGDTIVE